MVTDQQVRRLFALRYTQPTQAIAAAKAAMDVKTARKYLRLGKLPGEVDNPHTWRTRKDPFQEVWDEVRQQLELNPGLGAKTLFGWLQRQYPGRFTDGQLRGLQRRVRRWRALEGPAKEVFFAQVHQPGRLCQSDFTHLSSLGVRVAGQSLDHLAYHFVLTYSNCQTCTICFSQSFESLSEGLQNALWELGGVPAEHQTDRLSPAVCQVPNPEEFTQRYRALLNHYGLSGRVIQAGKANENGDIEQRHQRLKDALEQGLLLRGNRDFETQDQYWEFVRGLVGQLNAGRRARLAEELVLLRPLPDRRLEDCKRLRVRVDSGSLIHVDRNVYSVNSRLIGEWVEVRLHADHLQVWYGQKQVEQIPRLRGRGNHRIAYRHIIDWLVRKPCLPAIGRRQAATFENYRYRQDLFPTSRFRMAYDALRSVDGTNAPAATRRYLQILYLAARHSEQEVDRALRHLLEEGPPISPGAVESLLASSQQIPPVTAVRVDPVDLSAYDQLLAATEPNS